MTHDNRILIKESLLRLIGMKSSGTPADLARRFGISERSIKRMISELRSEGYDIVFWRAGNTYIIDTGYKHDSRVIGYYNEGTD